MMNYIGNINSNNDNKGKPPKEVINRIIKNFKTINEYPNVEWMNN